MIRVILEKGASWLQRWLVSKLVNSAKADADNPTLIEPVQVVAA
jgi:hypothetical protein